MPLLNILGYCDDASVWIYPSLFGVRVTEPFFPFLFTSRFTVFFHVFFSASWNRKKPIKEIIMFFKERKMADSKTMVTRSHQTGLAASKINGKTHLGWNYFPLNFFYPMESFKIYGIFNEILSNSLCIWSNSSQISTINFKHFLCNELLTFFGNAGIQFMAFLKNVGNYLHKKC